MIGRAAAKGASMGQEKVEREELLRTLSELVVKLSAQLDALDQSAKESDAELAELLEVLERLEQDRAEARERVARVEQRLAAVAS